MVEALVPKEEEDDKRVCARCINEQYLRSQIARHGKVAQCDYCQQNDRRCVTIGWLAERINPVYQQLVQLAEPVPDFSDDDDRVHWLGGGSNARDILYELIEFADDTIGDDLLGAMCSYDPEGLEEDMYDATSDIYELSTPINNHFYDSWRTFCISLRHEKRFFAEGGAKVLDDILGPVLKGGRGSFGDAIRIIGPEDADRYIFRARQANDEATRRAIYAAPAKQLGPPQPEIAAAGRMNAAGISVFYGSSDPTTCVAELRIPVGGSAVVGKFEIIRPLRLLDLTKIEQAESGLSKFHPHFLKMADYANFIRGFHAEIRKSVIPGKESLDYLPAQIVAEYLWSQARNPVDGIIFGSSQLSGERKNIVLFPNASAIEMPEEPSREITDLFQPSGHPDDEPINEVHAYYRVLPAAPVRAARPSLKETSWPWADDGRPELPAPALRLARESVQQIDVLAISYEARAKNLVLQEVADPDF